MQDYRLLQSRGKKISTFHPEPEVLQFLKTGDIKFFIS